jgi:hypothetical protein
MASMATTLCKTLSRESAIAYQQDKNRMFKTDYSM